MQMVNECLKRTTDENIMYDLLRDALKIAANLEGKERNIGDSQVTQDKIFLKSKNCVVVIE